MPWSKCINMYKVVGDAGSAMYEQLFSSVLQQRRKNPQDTVYTVSRALWREQRGRDGWEQEILFHKRLSPLPPNFSSGSKLNSCFSRLPLHPTLPSRLSVFARKFLLTFK